MEMCDGNRRLIHGQQSGGVDEDDWGAEAGGGGCCGGGGGGCASRRLRGAPAAAQTRAWSRGTCCFLTQVLLAAVAVALLTTITAMIARSACQVQESPNKQNADGTKQALLEDNETPSALLTAPHGNKTFKGFLAWESELGNAYCAGGFRYANGGLVVPRDGRYRVFLQITYSNLSTGTGDDVMLQHHLVVYREEYRRDVTLLSVVDTVSGSLKPWKRSLHSGGLFTLSANSILRVPVPTFHKLISPYDETLLFLGAHLLR